MINIFSSQVRTLVCLVSVLLHTVFPESPTEFSEICKEKAARGIAIIQQNESSKAN